MIFIDIKKQVRTQGGANFIKVNASFASKQITQITGPSGSGKTTLLRIIAGLIEPEEGKVIVDGSVWMDTRLKMNLEPQKRAVGFVFQDYALFPNMTVLEHLQFGSGDQVFIDRLISLGKLEDFKSHRPKQLSGGQQQRLGILRALSTQPKILLMDEPFSALDAALKKELISGLKILLSELEITCLVVTHHPFETEGFADQTFEML